MDEKLKDAITKLEKAYPAEPDVREALDVVLDLVRRYQDCPGWPQEKSTNVYTGSITDEDRNIFNRGYNSALSPCRLAHLKSVVGVAEMKEIMVKVYQDGIWSLPCAELFRAQSEALAARMEKGK